MEANKSTSAKSWRLVHDGSTVVALFESEGTTETIHYLFEADTEKECLAEVERLSLSRNEG